MKVIQPQTHVSMNYAKKPKEKTLKFDPVCVHIMPDCIGGWPNHESDVNNLAKPHWCPCGELAVRRELLLKCKKIVTPLSTRADILDKLHLDIVKCRESA